MWWLFCMLGLLVSFKLVGKVFDDFLSFVGLSLNGIYVFEVRLLDVVVIEFVLFEFIWIWCRIGWMNLFKFFLILFIIVSFGDSCLFCNNLLVYKWKRWILISFLYVRNEDEELDLIEYF